jgi:hypothetical protein
MKRQCDRTLGGTSPFSLTLDGQHFELDAAAGHQLLFCRAETQTSAPRPDGFTLPAADTWALCPTELCDVNTANATSAEPPAACCLPPRRSAEVAAGPLRRVCRQRQRTKLPSPAGKLAGPSIDPPCRNRSDYHFRKKSTEYDRKPGMKWLSCTAKWQS